jgi:hypothetical protein
MVEGRNISTILDLGTIWREVVKFMPRPLCIRGEIPGYPGWVPEPDKILAPVGNRTPTFQLVARRHTD